MEESGAALENAFLHYREALEKLCVSLSSRGIRVILCTPPPYAEFQANGNPPYPGGFAQIQRYAEAVRALAQEKGFLLADYHSAFSERYLHETLFKDDRIHPNDPGQFRMAECFCETFGLLSHDPSHPGEYIPLETVLKNAALEEWYSMVIRLRNIYSFESAFLHDNAGTDEEKIRFAEEFVREKKWGSTAFYELISKDYLVDKPQESILKTRIDSLTEAMYHIRQ